MVPGNRSLSTTRCAVTNDGSTVERKVTFESVPYSTCDVVGRLVVQVTVALERVMLLVDSSEVCAGVNVAAMPGVRLTVARPVGTANKVRAGEIVPIVVMSPAGVEVRVGVREGVGVGEKIGPTVTSASCAGVEAGRGV